MNEINERLTNLENWDHHVEYDPDEELIPGPALTPHGGSPIRNFPRRFIPDDDDDDPGHPHGVVQGVIQN